MSKTRNSILTLYKYTSTRLDIIKSCIENGAYASRLDVLNDPFESFDIERPDDYRVVCLTGAPKNVVMWAYYGNHKGCRIEYEISDVVKKKLILRDVKYVKTFDDHYEMSSEQLVESLYNKGNSWAHEKEKRAVWYRRNKYDPGIWRTVTGKDGKENIFLMARVKSIMLGYDSSSSDEYEKVLRYLLEYNNTHGEQITIQKCKPSRKNYIMIKDDQFDLQSAIQEIDAKKEGQGGMNVRI